jgi:hypothetical protein
VRPATVTINRYPIRSPAAKAGSGDGTVRQYPACDGESVDITCRRAFRYNPGLLPDGGNTAPLS